MRKTIFNLILVMILLVSFVESAEYNTPISNSCAGRLCGTVADRCGDTFCSSGESCSSCSSDCGTCPAAPSGGGGGGGGGGSSGGYGGAGFGPAESLYPITDNELISEIINSVGGFNLDQVKIDRIGSPQTSSYLSTYDDVLEVISLATNPSVVSYLQDVRNKVSSGEYQTITSTKTLTEYLVTDKVTGRKSYASSVEIVFTLPNDMVNIKLIETVDKKAAADFSELVFVGTTPKVLEADPVFEYSIDNGVKGQSFSFKYYFKERQSKLKGTSIAFAEIKKELPLCNNNGVCEATEAKSCADCASVCGNNVCEVGESMDTCCSDCGCSEGKECKSGSCSLIVSGEEKTLYTSNTKLIIGIQAIALAILISISLGYLIYYKRSYIYEKSLSGKNLIKNYSQTLRNRLFNKTTDQELSELDKEIKQLNKRIK